MSHKFNSFYTMMLFLLCLLAVCSASQTLSQNIFFPQVYYTGILFKGNDYMVLNSSEGIELHVYFEPETNVQYCETERNETSDNATLTFYAKQGGVRLYEASFAGSTQTERGNVSLKLGMIPYAIACENGAIHLTAAEPVFLPGTPPSPLLTPSVYDCVNRTRFTRRTALTPLNCTAPTFAPTFTPAPTIQALPGRDSGATDAHVSLFVSVVFVVIFFYFL